MGKKRPERTERRAQERASRQLVRDRERLFALSAGGSAERPLEVGSTAVIELRAEAMTCIQCGGAYRVRAHDSAGAGRREVTVQCVQCGVPRTLHFRIVSDEPN